MPRADGRTSCWGANLDGQLGLDAGDEFVAPRPLPSLSNVAEYALSGDFSCARITDGTVRCWGSNAYGRLGNGGTASSFDPVQVTGLTDATSLVAGWSFACAWRRRCGR